MRITLYCPVPLLFLFKFQTSDDLRTCWIDHVDSGLPNDCIFEIKLTEWKGSKIPLRESTSCCPAAVVLCCAYQPRKDYFLGSFNLLMLLLNLNQFRILKQQKRNEKAWTWWVRKGTTVQYTLYTLQQIKLTYIRWRFILVAYPSTRAWLCERSSKQRSQFGWSRTRPARHLRTSASCSKWDGASSPLLLS